MSNNESENKFITKGYLEQYNKSLCEEITNVVNSIILNSPQGAGKCEYIDQNNDNLLTMHFRPSGQEPPISILQAQPSGSSNTITFLGNTNIGTISSSKNLTVYGTTTLNGNTEIGTISSNKNLTVYGTTTLNGTTEIGTISSNKNLTVYGTTTLNGTTNLMNVNFQNTPTISGTVNVNNELKLGTAGKISTKSDDSAYIQNGVINSFELQNCTGIATFPQDIILDFDIDQYFSDRNTVIFIDTIGGIYDLRFHKCSLYSFNDQLNDITGGRVSFFEEDTSSQNSIPIINAIIQLGTCYSIADSNRYRSNNDWLPTYPSGIDVTKDPLFTPIEITKLIKNFDDMPGGNPYSGNLKPMKNKIFDFDDWRDEDPIMIPPQSIVILNIKPTDLSGGICVHFKRTGDYPISSSNEEFFRNQIPYARVFKNQFVM